MASAKFLEEALSTDVDESAVSAIVGSLETQLVSGAQPNPQQQQQQQQQQQSAAAQSSNGAPSSVVAAAAAAAATTPPLDGSSGPLQKPPQQHVANGTSNGDQQQQPQQPQQPQQQQQIPPTVLATTTTPSTTTSSNMTAAAPPVQELAKPTPSGQPQPQQQQQQQQQVSTMQPSPQQQFVPQQVAGNQVTSNQSNQLSALAKVQGEHVKIVYPGSGQVIATTGVVNANNKLTFPAQSVAQLANGTLGVVTTQTVLQSTSNSAVSQVSAVSGQATAAATNQAQTINVNKQTALVIKTSVAPTGMVSVPMSVPVTVAANITNTAQPGKAGVTSAIVPSNVQILNVNALRPATPQVAGQQPAKQVASRVVIGQHMMGGRAGTPGITLQTIQGLAQGGTQGHLLLKTENGQFQLLRVGPANPNNAAVTPNSIAGSAAVVATPGATGTTYRLASLPAVSRLNAQFTGPPLATIRKPIQTVAPTVTTTTVTAVTSTIVAATTTAPTPTPTPASMATPTPASTPTSTVSPAQASLTPAQIRHRQVNDNTKEKCRKFLANLLELSSREPKHVERSVRTLIQELIDVKVEPEEFCIRLERLLNASPQPCLIGFLRKSLPLLRHALITKELVIDGIRPPHPNSQMYIQASGFPAASPTVVTQQNQIRPTVAVSPAVTAATPVTHVPATVALTPPATTQVRVMAPLTGVTNVPRPPQPIQVQQKLIRPTTPIRPGLLATYSAKTPVIAAPVHHQIQSLSTVVVSTSATSSTTGGSGATTTTIRQTTGPIIVQKTLPSTAVSKTVVASSHKTITTTTTLNKAAVPSIQPKLVSKEKEKKTFSSAGYTGDDDINDVAAMGGVNLAEESQRILGSTKFVGTQIRSCKDEVFLHMTPLQQKINKIVSSYGLEEPNQEVASLISHAAQERLKNLVEKLAIIAEHRIDLVKVDPRYEVTQDVRAQLKFLEELDRVERKRHEEQEREVLLKAAKSRAKTEDPEQAKLKAKAKEMQRAEMEEARQREANQTALQAIGPRKKPKLDLGGSSASSPGGTAGLAGTGAGLNRQMPLRPRLKRVNFRDLLFLLEQEKETCRSSTLYRSYLK
ncbi:transcription initiation factor TFIID subunit 4 isoform X2 [Nasonia vitripennis]|uniref:TAFH domain-containing protein n=1 Tax=Nasonia vitripennis TaxID=7425 RepID=A0A7M7IYT2_NASVI|nr:transcription initiation factor TFIID subunit 4 isoform X2 [Nasonia vitripennis]